MATILLPLHGFPCPQEYVHLFWLGRDPAAAGRRNASAPRSKWTRSMSVLSSAILTALPPCVAATCCHSCEANHHFPGICKAEETHSVHGTIPTHVITIRRHQKARTGPTNVFFTEILPEYEFLLVRNGQRDAVQSGCEQSNKVQLLYTLRTRGSVVA